MFDNEWRSFKGLDWKQEIDVRDFILENYDEYLGGEDFLEKPTKRVLEQWKIIKQFNEQERQRGGVYDTDTKIISQINSHDAGYINKDLEEIVGLQTDELFKRSFQPFGGIRTAYSAAKRYGYELDPQVVDIFLKYRKTHNDGVFDVYTKEMLRARKNGIITGLPDAYGRGRIIGDYRRLALYGLDYLMEKKREDKQVAGTQVMSEEVIRLREEISEQMKALAEIKKMAEKYGCDVSKPASNAKEAFQWTYFAYLAAIKEQNGAAMSIGRISTFLDIYLQRDLNEGTISETQAQELVDNLVIKLRIVKFMRTPEYNELFSGDPTWVTESVAGMNINSKSLVTKNSFRFLRTLINLGPAPEPNLTVLWSVNLPTKFKEYAAKISILTSAIQYENDDLMRKTHGDDYAIACCVSPMEVGKAMQFFGARVNLPKALLYALNGGRDEITGIQVAPKFQPITSTKALEFSDVMEKYDQMLEWLCSLYVNTLNVIHYMHDKYSYEASQMAFYDSDVKRYFATGIAGISCLADSLSAIKYAQVYPIFNQDGLIVDFKIEGEFPKYGNDDNRVDKIAVEITKKVMNKIKKNQTYRHSIPTMSVLTITSNVVYGKKTGNTPDGRKIHTPFAPGANPMMGRDNSGAISSLRSVSKIPWKYACDGISNTFTLVKSTLDYVNIEEIEFDIELSEEQKRDAFKIDCGNC